jgi:hypothetical protein
LDQPVRPVSIAVKTATTPASFDFAGERKLSRSESEGVVRAVRILFAAIAGQDTSGGIMKSWRNNRNKPLDSAVAKDGKLYPRLRGLLTEKTLHGTRLQCDEVAREFAVLCEASGRVGITPSRAQHLIAEFTPVVLGYSLYEPMQNVFTKAHAIIDAPAI